MNRKLTPTEIKSYEVQRVAIALHNERPGTPVVSTIFNIGDDLRYWFRSFEWSIITSADGYTYTKIARADDPWMPK
jgi:hypothetical protein